MINTIGETVLDKTPGLNNPETFLLTHNRFNKHLVLIVSDLKKTQIYKIPYRNSPYHEIEIIMSFKYLNLFKPIEHTDDYYNRGPNDKDVLFEIEDTKCVYVG